MDAITESRGCCVSITDALEKGNREGGIRSTKPFCPKVKGDESGRSRIIQISLREEDRGGRKEKRSVRASSPRKDVVPWVL